MKSHPEPQVVLDELGDKVVHAVSRGVAHAKEQLDVYRESHPAWLNGNAPRTIACLIHDWMWSSLIDDVRDFSHVVTSDNGTTRELVVQVDSRERLTYRIRVKRHHLDGRTSSYPTQTVLDFEAQGLNQTFPGFGECRLEVGYEWDTATRTMGPAVITLRDGQENVLWTVQLPAPPASGGATVTRPTTPGPTQPFIDVAGSETHDSTGSDW